MWTQFKIETVSRFENQNGGTWQKKKKWKEEKKNMCKLYGKKNLKNIYPSFKRCGFLACITINAKRLLKRFSLFSESLFEVEGGAPAFLPLSQEGKRFFLRFLSGSVRWVPLSISHTLFHYLTQFTDYSTRFSRLMTLFRVGGY